MIRVIGVPFTPVSGAAGQGGYWLRFDDKALRSARRRTHERSPAFLARYRFRVGIEGSLSALDRRTEVNR